MKIYVGQCRGDKLIAELSALGYGEMTNRGEAPPRRFPFALDNGAYKDFTAGNEFREDLFLRDLERIKNLTPDFICVPDRVAGGLASLAFSLSWVPRLREIAPAAPLFLAVQDGMTAADVLPVLSSFAGIFIGGTDKWKTKTAEQWVKLAHSVGLLCHLGRAGTPRKVAWAKRIKADSLDSCFPLWCEAHLWKFNSEIDGRQGILL